MCALLFLESLTKSNILFHSYFFRFKKPLSSHFTLTVSIDGLPLHNSSSTQFWPILFKIKELPEALVMIAAILCGLKKPESVEEYLNPLVNELNLLHDNGITIKGSHITIKLEAIVADTPARAFIKGKFF